MTTPTLLAFSRYYQLMSSIVNRRETSRHITGNNRKKILIAWDFDVEFHDLGTWTMTIRTSSSFRECPLKTPHVAPRNSFGTFQRSFLFKLNRFSSQPSKRFCAQLGFGQINPFQKHEIWSLHNRIRDWEMFQKFIN